MDGTDDEGYITLISSDNHKFVILKKVAVISGTLKGLLNSNFRESQQRRINLPEIDGILLEKIIEYLYYNYKYKDDIDIPEFPIPTEMALELLVAADYLDV